MSHKILIINDNNDVVNLINTFLIKAGYQTKDANNGLDGLRKALNWLPDLIVLDVMMPEMNGFEVCEQLRSQPITAKIPVLLVSALSNPNEKVRGLKSGADDFIIVPFHPAELLARISTHLKRYDELKKVQNRAPAQGKGKNIGKSIALFSLRGGSGVSTFAVNLAIAFRLLWEKGVGILDIASPVGVCDVMLNIKPSFGLGNLVLSEISEVDRKFIENHLYHHESGVQLLGGTVDPVDSSKVTPEYITKLFEIFQNKFDYFVVDTSHDFSERNIALFDLVDEIVVPITPDISSVQVTFGALSTFDQLGYSREKIKLVLNKPFDGSGLSREQLERVLRQPIAWQLGYIPDLHRSINLGHPAILGDNESLALWFMDMAWALSRDIEKKKLTKKPSIVANGKFPFRMKQSTTGRLSQLLKGS